MKSNDDQKTRQALKAILSLPAQDQTGSEREVVAVYMLAVEGIPSDFIALACKRFIQGQVQRSNVAFRPSPPELAVEARRLLNKALDEQRFDVMRLPKPESNDPPDPTPEERQRCAEMWAKARREIEAAAHSTRMPRKSKWGPTVPDYTPKFDVSDFPSSNASPSELRAWEARQKAAA